MMKTKKETYWIATWVFIGIVVGFSIGYGFSNDINGSYFTEEDIDGYVNDTIKYERRYCEMQKLDIVNEILLIKIYENLGVSVEEQCEPDDSQFYQKIRKYACMVS